MDDGEVQGLPEEILERYLDKGPNPPYDKYPSPLPSPLHYLCERVRFY